MKTIFLLMARYEGLPVIPVETVCKDFFGGMLVEVFLRKVMADEIRLPIVRTDASRRCARGVNIDDLAAFLDLRTEIARRECEKLKRG
jgi:hypothetical protein